jgi:hypothetical protein
MQPRIDVIQNEGMEGYICRDDFGRIVCLSHMSHVLAIRVVIHFLLLMDLPNTEISLEISSVDGKVIIWLRVVRNWIQCFANGNHNREDGRRPIVLCQPNMWTRFTHSSPIIQTFSKNGLLRASCDSQFAQQLTIGIGESRS